MGLLSVGLSLSPSRDSRYLGEQGLLGDVRIWIPLNPKDSLFLSSIGFWGVGVGSPLIEDQTKCSKEN